MKYATEGPYADPEKAARRILEICNGVELFRAESTSISQRAVPVPKLRNLG
jgi:hypothetical protein